jgi:hypothetical protein
MIKIGTRVKIKDNYPCYKTMQGLTGTVVWMLPKPSENLRQFQVQVDKAPNWKGKQSHTCFVDADEVDVLDKEV